MADTTVNFSDIKKGEEILLSLIYPITADDMNAEQTAEFAIASSEQAEFAASDNKGVVREEVGDVSVTYADSGARAVSVCGERIAPAAAARLLRCGLLRRWI